MNKASLYCCYKNKESIFAEVIFSEANEFLTGVAKEVDKTPGCKEKILTYLVERLNFIRNAVNLQQLSIDSVQKLVPLFCDIYNRTVDKEIAYLTGILECCMKNGELIACNAGRVAKSIITVTEAIKNRLDNCTSMNTSESTHTEAVNEVIFTVSLLLDGLKK